MPLPLIVMSSMVGPSVTVTEVPATGSHCWRLADQATVSPSLGSTPSWNRSGPRVFGPGIAHPLGEERPAHPAHPSRVGTGLARARLDPHHRAVPPRHRT